MPKIDMNASVSNGGMTWSDFVKHCEDFVKISDDLNDDWALVGNSDKNIVGESYLMKKTMKYLHGVDTENEECESDCTKFVGGHNITHWEYHILYSPSYCVPTLYFNAWKRDGCILKLDEISRDTSRKMYDSNKTSVLSQQEHPLLRRPFFYIHPCDTSSILQSCKAIISNCKSVNPIITWLSTIATAVQLDLPSEYARSLTA